MPTENDVSAVSGIYSRWCKELLNFSAICGQIEFNDCKSSSNEKVLSQQDKQTRLVSNPKSKPGRKKTTKSLRKPDTPEKEEMEKRLIEGIPTSTKKKKAKETTKTTKKAKLESQFKTVETKAATTSSSYIQPDIPKRGRGRPKKTI